MMGYPGGMGEAVAGGASFGNPKTFEDLLQLVGCSPQCIAIIQNTNIRSLVHVLTWNETELDKMFRTFRKCGIDILPDVEKNFQLMVSEAQIRYQTHRQLGEMHSAKVKDFVRWQYRQSEKREFKRIARFEGYTCCFHQFIRPICCLHCPCQCRTLPLWTLVIGPHTDVYVSKTS
jgi:hypothetical protein